MNYWVQLATEQFPPSELVDQAVEAERAGFDAVNVSDHPPRRRRSVRGDRR